MAEVFFRIVIDKQHFTGDTFYGSFQEYGTKFMKAKYFMKRGFEQTRKQVESRARDLITAGIIRELTR